jgi:predicted enzyme related to lactoylglutathione lyase
MPCGPGRFAWHERVARDAGRVAPFHEAVLGGAAQQAGLGGPPCFLMWAGKTRTRGMKELTSAMQDAGAQAGWRGGIAAPDLDDMARRVRAGLARSR